MNLKKPVWYFPVNHRIVEMLELPDQPYFIATQGHPEFKSRPNRAHPLFRGLIESAVNYRESK